MNRKQILLSIVLVALVALDAYAIYLYGYIGFFRMAMLNFAGVTSIVDMVIALMLILMWIGNDAEQRGISALPYILLTLVLGSVGPLLYLIRRFADATADSPALAARPLHN